MGDRAERTGIAAAIALTAATGGAAIVLGGCNLNGKSIGSDVLNGKMQFIATCGSCHVLNHAGTKGTTGPNLDQAFDRARHDGLKTVTIEGIVHDQILYPNRKGVMPAGLVKGRVAADVAAYVAKVAAKPGKDEGALATVGQSAQKALAAAQAGKLEIDAAQAGLLFDAKAAKAPPGALTVIMKNPSSTPHNIALESAGKTIAAGPVVNGGGVSQLSTTVAKGSYTFYCQVPGHRQAGMAGTLTVG